MHLPLTSRFWGCTIWSYAVSSLRMTWMYWM